MMIPTKKRKRERRKGEGNASTGLSGCDLLMPLTSNARNPRRSLVRGPWWPSDGGISGKTNSQARVAEGPRPGDMCMWQ
jgi:hypothetical protein